MATGKATFRIEGEDATAAAFNSALGRAQSTATKISRAFNVAFSFIAGNAIVQSVTEATLKFERINTTLKVVSGSARAAGESFGYISELSDRLGLDLATTAQGFASFSAAAMGTSLEGQQTREIFESVATAARALSLSTDDTEGALRALSQMISKGNVQAEELRGQLGERLPGAFQLAARAMGVTTAELNKMLEQGQVAATDLLPKLAVELQKAFGKDAQEATDTLGANVSRLSTAWDTFKAAVGDTLPIKNATKALTELLKAGSDVLSGRSYDQMMDPDGLSKRMIGFARQRLANPAISDEDRKRYEDRIRFLQLGIDTRAATAASQAPKRDPMPAGTPVTKAFKAQAEEIFDIGKETQRLMARISREGAEDVADDVKRNYDGTFYTLEVRAKEATETITDYSRRAAENMQDAFANFLFDPFQDGLKGMLRGFIDVIRQMVAQQAAAQLFGSKASGGFGFGDALTAGVKSLFGFANGGSFRVGGSGGTDSQTVAFRATPGEMVDIRTPGQSRGGVMVAPVYNIDARGATQDLIRALPGILRDNNASLKAEMVGLIRGGAFA